MGTSDVFQVLKIVRAAGECNFENLKNITSDHISRNVRAYTRAFFLVHKNKNNGSMLLACSGVVLPLLLSKDRNLPDLIHPSFL